MIDFNEAKSIYESRFPNKRMSTVLDLGHSWVVSAVDKTTEIELDESPVAINKETGEITVFFPPQHREELRNATQVDIDT